MEKGKALQKSGQKNGQDPDLLPPRLLQLPEHWNWE